MAINKKLVHFKTFANFSKEEKAGNILNTSIVFIQDTQLIYTHGKLYYCSPETLATLQKDGLLSKEDKGKIDEMYLKILSIWEGNPDLVTPTLSGTWTVYKQDNTVVTPTPSFPLEFGYKAKYTGTWKWTSASGKKNPTATTGTWGTTLPASGVNSASYTSPSYVTTNTTYSLSISAPKLGLMVSGLNVLPASGNDVKSASTSISFSNRIYYGASTSTTPSQSVITGLSNKLGGRGNTVTGVTATGTLYYYYAYPKSLGALSTIIQDGATPVLGAFTRSELTITNAAGLAIPMYVYRSNNLGAFTNNTLKFE